MDFKLKSYNTWTYKVLIISILKAKLYRDAILRSTNNRWTKRVLKWIPCTGKCNSFMLCLNDTQKVVGSDHKRNRRSNWDTAYNSFMLCTFCEFYSHL